MCVSADSSAEKVFFEGGSLEAGRASVFGYVQSVPKLLKGNLRCILCSSGLRVPADARACRSRGPAGWPRGRQHALVRETGQRLRNKQGGRVSISVWIRSVSAEAFEGESHVHPLLTRRHHPRLWLRPARGGYYGAGLVEAQIMA